MMTFIGTVVILLSLSTSASKTQFDNSFVFEIFVKCFTYPKFFFTSTGGTWKYGDSDLADGGKHKNSFQTHLKNTFAAAPSREF